MRTMSFLLCLTCAVPSLHAQQSPTIAIVNGTVFRDATSPPIERGVVLIARGEISAVGSAAQVGVPSGAQVIDASGMTVLPGFWNSHVHFSESKWDNATSAPAAALSAALADIALSRGFTSVVDIGSFLENTVALRRRIASGEVTGPEIRTTGMPFVPPGGNPFYVEPIKLTELPSPEIARSLVSRQLDAGADYVKVFSGSPVSPGKIAIMPADVLMAVCATAHARGRLVFAHPTSTEGLRRAIETGVDVIAHTTPDDRLDWDPSLVREMRQRAVSVIPTLKLWTWELQRRGVPSAPALAFVAVAQRQLRAYADAGGSILFGTDVGYMSDYDPRDEYMLMSGAGLTFAQILASLTSEPARHFGVANAGRLAAGMRADVVIVGGRPDVTIEKLANIVTVIRGGRIVYRQSTQANPRRRIETANGNGERKRRAETANRNGEPKRRTEKSETERRERKGETERRERTGETEQRAKARHVDGTVM